MKQTKVTKQGIMTVTMTRKRIGLQTLDILHLFKLPKADCYKASRTLHPSSPSKRNVFNIVWPKEYRVRLDVKGNPGPVIWDSGASVCVKPTKENFHCYTKNVDIKNLQSFTKSGTPVVGMGKAKKTPSSLLIAITRLRTVQTSRYHYIS